MALLAQVAFRLNWSNHDAPSLVGLYARTASTHRPKTPSGLLAGEGESPVRSDSVRIADWDERIPMYAIDAVEYFYCVDSEIWRMSVGK